MSAKHRRRCRTRRIQHARHRRHPPSLWGGYPVCLPNAETFKILLKFGDTVSPGARVPGPPLELKVKLLGSYKTTIEIPEAVGRWDGVLLVSPTTHSDDPSVRLWPDGKIDPTTGVITWDGLK